MFTPLTQGKESRIIADPHPFIGGRFKAHPAVHSSSSDGGQAAASAQLAAAAAAAAAPSSSVAQDVQRIFTAAAPSPRTPTARRRRRPSQRFRDEREGERAWLLRPSRERVESWLNAWWKRWMLLVIVPSLIVWAWCAIPFPVSDPYAPHPWPDPSWNWTRPSLEWWKTPSEGHSPMSIAQAIRTFSESQPDLPEDLPVDINFWFFLSIYYGAYLAVALIWVTCLFNLYRLNWWPKKLGGAASYATFWAGSLAVGAIIHYVDLFGMERKRKGRTGRNREGNSIDWERKTFWVTLAFVTMSLPAVVCFGKLRRDRRMTYRHSLTEMQKTFLERQLGARIPKSYIRFLWFLGCILLAILAGIAGQAYMAVYLGTLPHGSIESIVYVWTWVLTSSLLGAVTTWILEKKVGSRALDFVFRLYFQLTYHVFYRTLFARLRKAEQFLYLQTLSSIWIVIFYPAYMSRTAYKVIGWLVGNDRSYAEHADTVAVSLYIRNLSENVTMFAFLGWLTILHFGPNREVYPFFDFAATDVYNYERTALSSLIIWAFEILSSFIARAICNVSFKMDVTNTGLDTLREYPELLPACVWASVHVCMDILLFLVTYNFR